jgi:hypothetical protein
VSLFVRKALRWYLTNNQKGEKTMNKIHITVTILIMLTVSVFALDLPHPLDFKGNDVEKERVISYIKLNVKQTYSAIGMGDPATLRMMEEEELKSFKQLTEIKNRKLLDSVIATYCEIGMCNYSTILMMYQEQLKASKKELTW